MKDTANIIQVHGVHGKSCAQQATCSTDETTLRKFRMV